MLCMKFSRVVVSHMSWWEEHLLINLGSCFAALLFFFSTRSAHTFEFARSHWSYSFATPLSLKYFLPRLRPKEILKCKIVAVPEWDVKLVLNTWKERHLSFSRKAEFLTKLGVIYPTAHGRLIVCDVMEGHTPCITWLRVELFLFCWLISKQVKNIISW